LFDLSKNLLSLVLLVAGSGTQPVSIAQTKTAPEIKVAAAADLSAAMDKLSAGFEKQSGIHITVSFGSSGNFFAQIQNGAPFDVFLSADKSYPEKLEQSGQTEGAIVPYARGQLVVWTANSTKLDLAPKADHILTSLQSPAINKIAIANPEHAPYGRAAVAALTHDGVYDSVKSKIVLGENISQTAQFAQSGNADVALIALSLALSEPMQHSGHYVLVPQNSYPPIEQAGVVIKSSQHQPEARRFLEYLTSAEARSILHGFGFGDPGLTAPNADAVRAEAPRK
jgi:molybdate transport system substrate-binding protein